MTASDWNWLLTIAGVVSSVVGVVFSWMAWVQAKAAKKAAEDATKAVRTQETAFEFSKMATDAKRLLEAVQSKAQTRAVLAATDLAHWLLVTKGRRADLLPAGLTTELCVENLERISSSLATNGFPTNDAEMEKLLRRCHQIHSSLCGIAGSVDRLQGGNES